MRTNKQHIAINQIPQSYNCWYPCMSNIGSSVVKTQI